MKHPPGEWQANKVKDSDDNELFAIHTYTDNRIQRVADVWLEEHAKLISAAPDLLEACTRLPEPKSLLSEAAYTGGDVPKKWINDRGKYIEGYNRALTDIRKHLEQAVTKATA